MAKTKTTWTTSAGTMTFFLSERRMFNIPCEQVDQPITLCKIMDVATTKLSPDERRALMGMLTLLESKETSPPVRGGLTA